MPYRPVQLRSQVVLVPGSGRLYADFQGLADREGFPRSPYDVGNDLNALRAAGGVPVRLDEPPPGKSDWSVVVYTRRYLVRLFLTKKFGDAYSIAKVTPLRLRDHQQLAAGYLLVRPRRWLVVDTPQQIPQGASPGWDLLVSGWDELTASMAMTVPPTSEQDGYLRTLGAVIDATERITAESEASPGYPYRQARTTAGSRSGATQLYEFTLAGARVPDEGAFVQVAAPGSGGTAGNGNAGASGGVRARGQVTRVSGMTVTIRFDEPVDWRDLQGQGEITTTTSTVVYRMQREAVGQLRTGRARNPGVLAALVDHRVTPPVSSLPPGTGGQPAFALNPGQREAFGKALAKPDLLAVIGPPGTGKTTTITEIVRAAAGDGERVIVCSQNNRAVDNVLGRLPADLLAIRVGNESRVTAEGLPYLLQRRAADLRTQTLNVSRRNLDGYARLGDAESWANELSRRNAGLRDARDAETRAKGHLDAARRAAGGPATAEVDRLTEAHAAREQEERLGAGRAQRLAAWRDRMRALSAWLIIGWFCALIADRLTASLRAEQAATSVRSQAVQFASAELQAAWQRLIHATKDVPAVISARSTADTAAARGGEQQGRARQAAWAAGELAQGMGAGRLVGNVGNEGDDELFAAEGRLADLLPRLAARRDLLAAWVTDAAGETDQLYPELIRYADVLASTCTGAGSRPEIADLDFDLAIVDEAGQIGVADALIPLVRGRRAVLVGDHMQLPPFLDSEVASWGKLVGDPVVTSMLAKSALEMVVNALPPDSPNVTWLTEQRRMPEVIAAFASAQFYGGRLETPPGLRTHRDDVFRSALVLVDTSDTEWPQRRERSGRDRERWGQQGYDNPGEARLLADLATYYDRAQRDWAVIVPYLAQAEYIRRLLAGLAGDAEKVRLNVGTVDSFQGGERDVILYGFTRSNPERRVGFLAELRRVNVAITRARQQLVLVGDMETLASARDGAFRALAISLRNHVRAGGELLPSTAARARLRAAGQESGTETMAR
jgi:hypothetical protein